MKSFALALVLLVAVVPLSGCLQTVSDLKSRLGATTDAPEELEKTVARPAPAAPTTNVTPKDPPVARMTIFGDNGGLVYRASFVGEDPAEMIPAQVGNFTFISTESEALTPGATLAKFAWQLDGKAIGNEKKANALVAQAGMHTVKLTVTDSNGLTDSQAVMLFIAPVPFDVTTDILGGPLAGASGAPTASEAHKFPIATEIDGKTVKPLAISIVLTTGPAHDSILTILDPAGTETSLDQGSAGAGESAKFSDPAVGDWTFTAGTFAGATPDHAIKVVVTYVEVVEGAEHGAHGH